MTPKQSALYALMEERGYSYAAIQATMMMLGEERGALDDMILYIEDEAPTEEEIIEKVASLYETYRA
ncbi:MAG: hypothetical protein IKU88_06575 [Alistipes sp.]|nr:hypothetical protein [Alistipes sp.]